MKSQWGRSVGPERDEAFGEALDAHVFVVASIALNAKIVVGGEGMGESGLVGEGNRGRPEVERVLTDGLAGAGMSLFHVEKEAVGMKVRMACRGVAVRK